MTNYKRVKAYWEAFSVAIEDNEIEIQNLLIEKIEELLPFRNEEEHNQWSDYLATWMCWEELEERTFNIAKRLKGGHLHGNNKH